MDFELLNQAETYIANTQLQQLREHSLMNNTGQALQLVEANDVYKKVMNQSREQVSWRFLYPLDLYRACTVSFIHSRSSCTKLIYR